MNLVNKKKHYTLDGFIKVAGNFKQKNNFFNYISQDEKVFEY